MFGPGVHLISLVRAHVGVLTDDIERAGVFVHEWRALDPGRREAMARRRDAYEARFRAAIADGIESILDNPKKAEGQRQRGFERSRLFDWDLTAARTLEFYRKVLA